MKYANWLKETERFKHEHLTQRTGVVLNQLRIRGLYPDLPEIEGGRPAEGQLELRAGGFPIYYTTDGTDPRRFGGGVSPAARRLEGPVNLTAGTKVIARVHEKGEWGPVREFSGR
ncbi:MAG TPA: hypothetical protein DCY13_04525 [Verrucomicrobiales bacterium]|nr:hypothetical protein [Verrucomicrobiales bacterium]